VPLRRYRVTASSRHRVAGIAASFHSRFIALPRRCHHDLIPIRLSSGWGIRTDAAWDITAMTTKAMSPSLVLEASPMFAIIIEAIAMVSLVRCFLFSFSHPDVALAALDRRPHD